MKKFISSSVSVYEKKIIQIDVENIKQLLYSSTFFLRNSSYNIIYLFK